MRTNNLILPITLVALISCAKVDQNPSHPPRVVQTAISHPDQFPKKWLKRQVTVETVDATSSSKSNLRNPSFTSTTEWKEFIADLTPGKKLWYWEASSPSYFGTYTGYCILQNSTVIRVIHISTQFELS